MNRTFSGFAVALFVFVFAALVHADDFKSVVVPGAGTGLFIRVHGDQFMVIRNFTQEMGMTRGFVTVGTPPSFTPSVKVLTAAILNPMTTTLGSLEVINSVVIAGPANVMVTCDPAATCFISYKKDSN